MGQAKYGCGGRKYFDAYHMDAALDLQIDELRHRVIASPAVLSYSQGGVFLRLPASSSFYIKPCI